MNVAKVGRTVPNVHGAGAGPVSRGKRTWTSCHREREVMKLLIENIPAPLRPAEVGLTECLRAIGQAWKRAFVSQRHGCVKKAAGSLWAADTWGEGDVRGPSSHIRARIERAFGGKRGSLSAAEACSGMPEPRFVMQQRWKLVYLVSQPRAMVLWFWQKRMKAGVVFLCAFRGRW